MKVSNFYFTSITVLSFFVFGPISSVQGQTALATCDGITSATENNYVIAVEGLEADSTYDIYIDGTMFLNSTTGITMWNSANQAYVDGNNTKQVVINDGTDSDTITVHELLCVDIDEDGDIDQDEASCDYTMALPDIGTIIAQAAPHNTTLAYAYILTDSSGVAVTPLDWNFTGLFTGLSDGYYKVYAYNFLDTMDANTFIDSLSGGDDMDDVDSSAEPCYSFCGASETYTIDCPCLVNIDTEPSDITICEGLDDSISVAASINSPVPDGATLEYQWEEDSGSGFGAFADTDSILNLNSVTLGMDGNTYRIIITLDVDGTDICKDTSAVVTLTVDAKPILSSGLDSTICSDELAGIELSTSGGGTVANYNIPSATVATGLTGSATTGTGLTSTAISSDAFTNTTGGDLTVVYKVVPISTDGCAGDTVDVTVTVQPEPILLSSLDTTVCSDELAGIVLGTSGGTGASSYDIPSAEVGTGLTGSATTGTSLTTTAISSDAFTNPTGGDLTVVYKVVPISASGCAGDTVEVTLTVQAEPILLSSLDTTVCSDELAGIVLGTSGGTGASSYDIPSATVDPSLTGSATTGTSLTTTAISSDAFTNTTGGDLTVVYRVVPISAAGCAGDTVDVTLTVQPEPILLSSLDTTVCSDELAGIVLGTSGGTGASSYDIPSAEVGTGLTGSATTGTSLTTTAISSDAFTNTTGGDLTVVYKVVPISTDGCAGDTVDVTLTVQPEPILLSSLDTTVCSDELAGIVLGTSGGTGASSYDIPSAEVGTGLTGSATTGTSLTTTAISSDAFTNPTGGDLTVVYKVVPISASGCAGDTVEVTLTVQAEPILLSSLDTTVCSDELAGIVLGTSGGTGASSYDIPSATVDPSLTGSATTGTSLTTTAISSDAFTNTTGGDLTVVYRVVPISAAGCAGDTVDVTLTVQPEPILLSSLDTTVCSDELAGIVLGTSGGTGASSYDIPSAEVGTGLTGSATTGTSLTTTAISSDAFTNTTGGDLTVVYKVVPISTDGCAGDTVDVTLTVQPEPILLSSLDTTVCSDELAGIVLGTSGGTGASSYDIPSAEVGTGLTGSATTGTSLTTTAISSDAFTNPTGGDLTVVYKVVPISASGCAGDTVEVTLTVQAEPILLSSLDTTVCSDELAGIVLGTSGGTGASSYDIPSATVDPSLTGSATTGTSLTTTAISSDAFTNTTGGDLTVVYRVVPISAAGCAGDTVDVTLTVQPEPILLSSLDTTVCSDELAGIVLGTSGGTGASSYDIPSAEVGTGLTGSATTGTSLTTTAISSDAFTNTTGGDLTVVYKVVPISTDGCAGDTVDVTLTVQPEPILLSSLDTTVCSDAISGIVLSTSGGTGAANYDIPSTTVDPSLTGSATTGTGLAAGAISNDAFTNTTTGDLTVVYRVVPISTEGCAGDTVEVTLTVQPKAVVEAGAGAPICSNGMVDLSSLGASITGALSTGTWTSVTSGTFDNGGDFGGGSPSTEYTPSAADIMAGEVTLTLTSADPPGECDEVLDTVTITINNVTCGSFPWDGSE